MRHILSLEQIRVLSNSNIDIKLLEQMLYNDNKYRHSLAKNYALKNNLHNGATLEFPADGYRNNNLLFWDAQNKKIVEPFREIDDYGSVPPRFVVGDGYFQPFYWLEEVDHNSFVFPAKSLIDEMKDFVEKNPAEKKMIVTINGCDYLVRYNSNVNWDSCILEVDRNRLYVREGEPRWRNM